MNDDKEQDPPLPLDEPPPRGQDAPPNPSRILGAAIGDCLCASLAFCLQRRGVVVEGLRAEVHVQWVRNEKKRWRIGKVGGTLYPSPDLPSDVLSACLETLEDYILARRGVLPALLRDPNLDTMSSLPEWRNEVKLRVRETFRQAASFWEASKGSRPPSTLRDLWGKPQGPTPNWHYCRHRVHHVGPSDVCPTL